MMKEFQRHTGAHSRAFGRRALIAACAGLFAMAIGAGTPARAAEPEVRLAIGGAGCLCYLPTVLAHQLGFYKKNGVKLRMYTFKGGSQALTAVIGGSADVVSGYYDHTVELAAKGKHLAAFTVYDRFPGLVLVVSPEYTNKITSIADLKGQRVGVSAPGSSTDFFVKYLLAKQHIDPHAVPVVGVGLGATAVAAMEHGQVQAAVMLDPAVTLLKGKYPNLRILVDTRSQADTLKVFGGNYPGGSFYAPAKWIASHPRAAQGMADAIAETLKWIHDHSAKEIMAHMPSAYTSAHPKLYLAALKNTLPMYSRNGLMDPKGATAVLAVFSQSDPEVAHAKVDLSATYTNRFAEKAARRFGLPLH